MRRPKNVLHDDINTNNHCLLTKLEISAVDKFMQKYPVEKISKHQKIFSNSGIEVKKNEIPKIKFSVLNINSSLIALYPGKGNKLLGQSATGVVKLGQNLLTKEWLIVKITRHLRKIVVAKDQTNYITAEQLNIKTVANFKNLLGLDFENAYGNLFNLSFADYQQKSPYYKRFAKEKINLNRFGKLTGDLVIHHRETIAGKKYVHRKLYLVTKYIYGDDLFNVFCNRQIPISKQYSFEYVIGVAKSFLLDYQSRFYNRYLHRDLKLENIILNEETRKCEIIDYQEVEKLDGDAKFYDKSFVGSKECVAPELLAAFSSYQQGKIFVYDKSTELYSLGIALRDLICSNPEYKENAKYETNIKPILDSFMATEPEARGKKVSLAKAIKLLHTG